LIYLLAYQSKPGNFSIFGQSDERYHLIGGNEGLPRAIAAALPPGSIQLGAALQAIVRNHDGTYALRLKIGSTKTTVVADRVILTIPFSILRTLDYSQAGFNAVKTFGIKRLGYVTNAKLQLQFNTRYWNQPGPWGLSNGTSYADTGYQSCWDVTLAQNGETGILVDYTGGTIGAGFAGGNNPAAVTAYAQNFLNQVEPVFPASPSNGMAARRSILPRQTRISSGRIRAGSSDSHAFFRLRARAFELPLRRGTLLDRRSGLHGRRGSGRRSCRRRDRERLPALTSREWFTGTRPRRLSEDLPDGRLILLLVGREVAVPGEVDVLQQLVDGLPGLFPAETCFQGRRETRSERPSVSVVPRLRARARRS
jgi:hypothetical protein